MLLQVDNVRFGYPARGRAVRPRVLDGISITVADGALVGILGPNGSGKTTLLRLVSGALAPETGSVRLDGTEVSALPRRELARRLAVVPQETHLAFDYTALEVVLMGRYPHLGAFEMEGPADLDAARSAMVSTGTFALADRPFATLSGGEKQRVVIASALAQLDATSTSTSTPAAGAARGAAASRAVLLLDEPTASLDLRYQLEVADLLRQLHGERHMTIVLSTHDLRFAVSVCSDVVLLTRGRVLAQGPPSEVIQPDLVANLYEIDAARAAPLLPR